MPRIFRGNSPQSCVIPGGREKNFKDFFFLVEMTSEADWIGREK
jgi:hypothetical protein